jgi:Co/Zn/Cd efflux system component
LKKRILDQNENKEDLEQNLNLENEDLNDEEKIKNMNIRAALIHLIGDTIQSIGVIISALVIYFGGQKYV